jgi:hypothetical protein
MESHDSSRLVDSIARRFGVDADAAHIAGVMISIWQEIEAVLIPVIGRGGFVALYGRGLHLASSVYPWLVVTPDPLEPMGFIALRAAVARQDNTQASAGCTAFLQTFHELLDNLVGSFLTEQLLGSVWVHSLSIRPASA